MNLLELIGIIFIISLVINIVVAIIAMKKAVNAGEILNSNRIE